MSGSKRWLRLDRRAFLATANSALALALLPARAQAITGSPGPVRLTAGPGALSLKPIGPEVTGAWGYNGEIPGPVLRYRQGERLRVLLHNDLDQATTLHWHGIRLPNAMDGVPHLTQPPVEPGDTFEYYFVLPDAGTYWYHPHLNGTEQLGRGLAGALIVDELQPYPVDRDLLWVLDDWRLDLDGEIVADFDDLRDISHAGRIGNTVTINGRLPYEEQVRPGERLRLRLLNVANARIFAPTFEGLPVHVIALDGQPVRPYRPAGGKVVLGPGMRVDLVLDCPGEPGRTMEIWDEFDRRVHYVMMDLAWSDEPVRDEPLDGPPALPANPLPEPILENAVTHEIDFGGGMMGGLGRERMRELLHRGMAWTVNGEPIDEHTAHRHPPLFTLERGRTCRLVYRNNTAWHHPIHLHGHHFRVLARNGSPERHRPLHDTVLIGPRETVETAFVADNPGDWMLHCHVLEHQAGGMTGLIRVT